MSVLLLPCLSALLLSAGIAHAAEPDSSAPAPLRPVRGEVLPTFTEPNLLPHGDFAKGLTGWSIEHAAEVEVDGRVITTDDGPALRLRRISGDGPIAAISEPIAVEPGTPYQLTARYHTAEATFGSLAELMVLESANAETFDTRALRISGPGRTSHPGHQTMLNRPAGQWVRKTRPITPGKDTRFVRVALVTEGPPATLLLSSLRLAKPEPENRPWTWPERESEPSRANTLRLLAERPDSTAAIREHAGAFKLHIDGQPTVPQFLMTDVTNSRRGYIGDFARHGVRVHMVALQNIWTGPETYDLERLDSLLWNAIGRDPQGHFVVYFSARPYADWHEQFAEHVAQEADGRFTTSRHQQYGPPSYWSPEYQRQVFAMLTACVRHIQAQPYARAVIGYFLTGGEDGQFYYQVIRRSLQDGQAPGVRPLLAQWLRRRYPTLAELRAAWGDQTLTWETARPPIEDRRYPGTFLDPATQRAEADFLVFLNEELGHFLSHMGRICKENTPKPVIVGAYYGRGGASMVYPLFAKTQVIFQSPWIDYLGAQPGYQGYREAANLGRLDWVPDSLRLHGKLPLIELDYRTWVSQYRGMQHDFQIARYWHLEELRGAMQRDIGKLLGVHGGNWWMEMAGGWFHEPSIMQLIEDTHRVSQRFYARDTGITPAEVVLVTDEKSLLWTSEQVNVTNGPTFHAVNLQQHAFYRAGVRFDHYYLSDLVEREMDHYKVYVFLNTFYPDDAARQFVRERLQRDGKVLFWQYAPGYLTDQGFSLEASQELTGLQLSTDPNRSVGLRARFAEDMDQALLAGVRGRLLGTGADLVAQRFTVDDSEARVLAHYASDGAPAAAMRQMPDHTSVFMGHPSGLTPAFVQNLARLGGAHAYLEPGDLLTFDRDDLIVLHGIEGGKKTLRLPFQSDLRDPFTHEILGQATDQLPLELAPGQTRWIELHRGGMN